VVRAKPKRVPGDRSRRVDSGIGGGAVVPIYTSAA